LGVGGRVVEAKNAEFGWGQEGKLVEPALDSDGVLLNVTLPNCC